MSSYANTLSARSRAGSLFLESAHALKRLAVLIPLVAWSALATAEEIEEIIVYGELRESHIENLPTSITVLDEELIRAQNASHLEEVLLASANVSISSGASRARFFQIRGVGERGQFIEPLNPSVGVLVDGVDFSGIGGIATLFDVEQIEVFRGPQGTLYGANALAGLIALRSRSPEFEPSGSIRLEAGDYGTWSIAGAYGGPISDRVAFRTSLARYESDGYMDNIFLGEEDTNNLNELTWRGKLRIDLTEKTRLDLGLGLVSLDNGYDAFSLDNNRRTRSDQPGADTQDSLFASLRLVTQSEKFDTEFSVAAADSDIEYGYDEDWTYDGFHPWGYSSTDQYNRERGTLSAELRLVSSEAGSLFEGRTDWVVGLYSLRQEVDFLRVYTYADSDFASQFEIQRLAVYGRTETQVSERARLTLGLRFEAHESDYSDSAGVAFRPNEDLFGGRLALNYSLSEQVFAYASFSRGYKAGGFNTDGTLNEDLREFDAEYLVNYEAGLKGRWPDAGLSARLSAFRMNREDVQIDSSITLVRADGSSEFIDFIGNAAEGVNQGVEAELNWTPSERFELDASLGLLNSEYENYVNGEGEDLGGREQAHAPRYQYHLAARVGILEGLAIDLTLEGRDEHYFSDSHHAKSRAYDLFHAALVWEWRQMTLRLWGRNLGDEDYFVRGYFFGNDPRDGYEGHAYTQLGEPRRYGLTLSREF